MGDDTWLDENEEVADGITLGACGLGLCEGTTAAGVDVLLQLVLGVGEAVTEGS